MIVVLFVFRRFKLIGNRHEQLSYRKMLRAYSFALSALDTVGRFSAFRGVHVVVVVIGVPVLVNLLCVHAGKQIGNGNVLGAAVGAVAARGAGNKVLMQKTENIT